MQAAFRAQNPCLFQSGSQCYRKENAYVFDFDPARTLMIFEKFANDLSEDTSDGRGDSSTRKEHIRELLNFFPVIGEDEQGEMVELDAERVLSIPRKIRCQEVVRRGFMSDYLFQNISNVFHAPLAVLDILQQLPAVEKPSIQPPMTPAMGEALSVDDNGDVKLTDDYVIGRAADVFGDRIYEDMGEKLKDTITGIETQHPAQVDTALQRLKDAFHRQAVVPIIDAAHVQYGADMRVAEQKRLDRKLTDEADGLVGRAYGDFSIKLKTLEQERKDKLGASRPEEAAVINRHFDAKQQEASDELRQTLTDAVDSFVQTAGAS